MEQPDEDTENLYTKLKVCFRPFSPKEYASDALQKTEAWIKHLKVQEVYIKDETRNLEKELLHAQEEVKRIQSVPLLIGQFLEPIDQNYAIVASTTGLLLSRFLNATLSSTGTNHYARILSTLDRELLKVGCSVALHKYSNALVDILPPESDSSIAMLRADEKPDVTYADIGGLDQQKQEVCWELGGRTMCFW